ncbi:MAG: DUF4286 family protein [Bacteroidota bacterium]
MVLYNVTVGVDKDIELEWLSWMKNEHIPEVMETGKFMEYKIFKVLGHDDPSTTSYSVQYFSADISLINEYLTHDAPVLIQKHQIKYKDRHVAFRTLLEEV